MDEKLIFVISPPRAGSTMLQHMLGAHSEVFTHPEPHLISPIAHLGYYANVDKAPYDHINAAEALHTFVDGLPRGEEDYLDALRAYAGTLYGRMLEPRPESRFLDKTPANALVLPFLARLFPGAKYLVLTRHPLAVFSSYANSFFNGDWKTAHEFNPILERYVPAMASFIRERPVPLRHVSYETLVASPEEELERIFAHLALEHQPEAVQYGGRAEIREGMGDPINVKRLDRPVTDSVERWAAELADDARKLELAQSMIARLADEDLETWGHPRETLFEPIGRAGGVEAPKPVLNRYTFKRRVMLALKKDIHTRWHGRVVKRIKYYCDVLLRD
jgi:hypothetical protein